MRKHLSRNYSQQSSSKKPPQNFGKIGQCCQNFSKFRENATKKHSRFPLPSEPSVEGPEFIAPPIFRIMQKNAEKEKSPKENAEKLQKLRKIADTNPP